MKKILYLMGIDWYWIKQRPQIIAEMLSKDYDITVAYYHEVFVKQSLRSEKDELEKSFAIPAIPYRDKNKLAFVIQILFFLKIVRSIQRYDAVWITHPLLYRYIPASYRGQIIYDCMDNHAELCGDAQIRRKIVDVERDLVERADLIFTSSVGLKKKILSLKRDSDPVLVRNGFVPDKLHLPAIEKKPKEKYRIGYFGTIAEWFDFSILLATLDYFPQLEYHLWGPVANIELPHHSRIIMEGVIEHSGLWNGIKTMDCLIMPFKLTEAIKDVDPVKLYEYISMGKAIVSVYYSELDRFKPFVHFYYNSTDLSEIFHRLIFNNFQPGYDASQQREFLEKNSWLNRYIIIKEKLEGRSAREF